jgi:uncharacterized membrane protein YfcA
MIENESNAAVSPRSQAHRLLAQALGAGHRRLDARGRGHVVDLWMVAALLMGSIPGVLIGSRLTVRAPTRVLRSILAAVLFLSGLALVFKS